MVDGGGAGFFGGGSATNGNDYAGGGGGSGYIGNTMLTDKYMASYSASTSNNISTKTINAKGVDEVAKRDYAKQGNGYFIITNINENNNE